MIGLGVMTSRIQIRRAWSGWLVATMRTSERNAAIILDGKAFVDGCMHGYVFEENGGL